MWGPCSCPDDPNQAHATCTGRRGLRSLPQHQDTQSHPSICPLSALRTHARQEISIYGFHRTAARLELLPIQDVSATGGDFTHCATAQHGTAHLSLFHSQMSAVVMSEVHGGGGGPSAGATISCLLRHMSREVNREQ